jgi:hypothetical protein
MQCWDLSSKISGILAQICKRSQKDEVFVDADVDIPAVWHRGKSDRADYDCPDWRGIGSAGRRHNKARINHARKSIHTTKFKRLVCRRY